MLLGTHPFYDYTPPTTVWVSNPDFKHFDNITEPKILRWLPVEMRGSYVKDEHKRILPNGSILLAKSEEQDTEKVAGGAVHLIWHDEEPKNESHYNEWLARITDFGGRIIISATCVKGYHWIHKAAILNEKKDSRVKTYFVNIMDNPLLSREDKEFFYKSLTTDKDRMIRFSGAFVPRAGLVVPEIEEFYDLVVLPRHVEPEKEWSIFRVIDPGVNNPCGCLFIAVKPNGDKYIYDEYAVAGRTIAGNSRAIIEQTGNKLVINTYIDPMYGRQRIAVDRKAPGRSYNLENAVDLKPATYLDLYAEHLGRVTLAYDGKVVSKEEGIDRLRQALAPRPAKDGTCEYTISPRCISLIEQLRTYHYSPDRGDNPRCERPEHRGADLVDCFRYACSSRLFYRQRYKYRPPKILNPILGV